MACDIWEFLFWGTLLSDQQISSVTFGWSAATLFRICIKALAMSFPTRPDMHSVQIAQSAFGRVATFSGRNTTNKQFSLVISLYFFFFSRIASFPAFPKILLFDANWYILTFLNLDLLTFFTSICFADVKFNIIICVKDVTVASRFDPSPVFSYAFFFVKIITLLNSRSCFQIFFICLCPAIMGFDDRKGIYMRDDSVLLLITHFGVLIMFTSSHPVLTYQ